MKNIVGRFIVFFIILYLIMLTLRVILSWIKIPQYKWVYWLCRFTDPVIEYFRKEFPIKFGVFDLSIATPCIILLILIQLVSDFMIGDYQIGLLFNIWYILGLLIFITKLIFNFILFILIIFTFILLIVKLLSPYVQNPAIDAINSILNPMLNLVEKILKLKSERKELIYLVILLIFFIVLNGVGSYFFEYLKALSETNLRLYYKDLLKK